MSMYQQYYEQFRSEFSAACHPNASKCVCGGRGWKNSEVDTWHECPHHKSPHPESEEGFAGALERRDSEGLLTVVGFWACDGFVRCEERSMLNRGQEFQAHTGKWMAAAEARKVWKRLRATGYVVSAESFEVKREEEVVAE